MIGKYSRPVRRCERVDVGEDRHRLLRPDDRDGHDRHPRAHRRLDEAAAAEAAQLVAVLVELLGALAALGEDEHELLLVVQQAVHVGRVGGHAADLGHEHAEAGIALEEVLDGQVQRPRAGVLLLDRLEDHRRVGRERAGVVGDQQRAAGGRDVLDPLDLAAEPVVVEPVVDRAVHQALDPLRAAPVGDLALGLDRGQVRLQLRPTGAGSSFGALIAASPAGAARARGPARASPRRRRCPPPRRCRGSTGGSSVAARDARVDGGGEVDRRVVDQQLDPDLAAARDLVVGAVELVVGQPDPLQPARGGVVGVGVAVRGDVDEVAGLLPRADGLDGVRVGLGGEDLLVAVGLRRRRP